MISLASPITEAVASGRRTNALDEAVIARLTDKAGGFAIKLSIALLILVATLFASKWASQAARRGLSRVRGFRSDPTVLAFAVQVVRVGVFIVGFIAVLQQLGVQTTSIIAVLGAASLAVGLALQGTLSNVAAGVMLLVLRPYRVGDVVDLAGNVGSVQKLDLFTTQLSNGNNVKIVVPNSQVLSDVILNLSGLAAGAATVGCCCNMVGFAVASYRENKVGGLLAQGIGTSMLQVPNIVKKPVIWLPAIISSAILGPVGTMVLHMTNNATGSGMGTAGLVGQIMTWQTMIQTESAQMVLIKILLIQIVLPAVVTLGISEFMRKKDWIKTGDMKLEF